MKKVAFTAVDDRLFYPEGTHILINSFRRFHPDIDLVVFRQDVVDKLFAEKNINWYQAKPYFAELLEDKYDLVVNIDADTIILNRLTEVFDKENYETGSVWNYNEYENAAFENITEKMYVQAGLVASYDHNFWVAWRRANYDAMKYLRKENDTMNLVWYNDPKVSKTRRKIFDKDKDYYGCKSLGREPQFYIEDGKTMCQKEEVKAYHFARGNTFPKLDISNMPLTEEVKQRWQDIAMYGQTVKITNALS